MKAYTDYFQQTPEEVTVLSYDGNKYCVIKDKTGEHHIVKSGHLYSNMSKNRVNYKRLNSLPLYSHKKWTRKQQAQARKRYVKNVTDKKLQLVVHHTMKPSALDNKSLGGGYYRTLHFSSLKDAARVTRRFMNNPFVTSLELGNLYCFISNKNYAKNYYTDSILFSCYGGKVYCNDKMYNLIVGE